MKKILGMAVLVAAAVIFAYVYRLQTVGFLEASVMAVERNSLTEILKNGIQDQEDMRTVDLEEFEAGSPIYRRGSRYYMGETKENVDLDSPFYTNDGTALYFMGDALQLLTTDFAALETYEGLYVSDGAGFHGDRSQADQEEYILASLPGGIYINVQPMEITAAGQNERIRINSQLGLETERIRSYSYEDGKLVYGEIPVMFGAQVTIGSLTMPYTEFLAMLSRAEDMM